MAKVFRTVSAFGANRIGATAVMFAMLLIPVILIVGAAIDYSRANSLHASIQNTLDSAALAGGSALMKGEDVEAAVHKYMQASWPAEVELPAYTVEVEGRDVKVKFPDPPVVKTKIMSIMGMEDMKVKAAAVSTLGMPPVDIGILLDRSDSMKDSAGMMMSGAGNFATKLNALNQGVASVDQAWAVFTSFQRDTPRMTGGDYGNPRLKHGDVLSPFYAAWIGPEINPDKWNLYDGNTPAGIALYWTRLRMLTNTRCSMDSSTCSKTPDRYMILVSDGDDDNIHKWDCPSPCTIESICPTVKASGIHVMTIEVPGISQTDRLKACASSEDDYFYASKLSELDETFDKILGRMMRVRLKE
jgi:hypothetical protein